MSKHTTTPGCGRIEPMRPGEVLMEDFVEGSGIMQNKLHVSIGVPQRILNEIVHGKPGSRLMQ